MRLDDYGDDHTGSWGYNNGNEFQGARGGLEPITDTGQSGLALTADFSAGGRYVGLRRKLGVDGVRRTQMVRFRVRTTDVTEFSVRFVDETGQCHQRGGLKLNTDGKWQTIELDPLKIAGGEHWAGANDGQWHGALSFLELMLNTRSSASKSMKLELTDLHVEAIVEADVASTAWTESFETKDATQRWQIEGDVQTAMEDDNSVLQLSRTLDGIRNATAATGPSLTAIWCWPSR